MAFMVSSLFEVALGVQAEHATHSRALVFTGSLACDISPRTTAREIGFEAMPIRIFHLKSRQPHTSLQKALSCISAIQPVTRWPVGPPLGTVKGNGEKQRHT